MIDFAKAKAMVDLATEEFLESDLYGWTLDVKSNGSIFGNTERFYFTDDNHRKNVIAEYKFWNPT